MGMAFGLWLRALRLTTEATRSYQFIVAKVFLPKLIHMNALVRGPFANVRLLELLHKFFFPSVLSYVL